MLEYASSYPWRREGGFIRPARENATWSIAAIEDEGGQIGGDDDIDLLLIAPQLAEEVIRLREEIAKETIRETYTEDEEERGRRMTDEAKEIIDLARKRDHHHKGLNETSRELAERNLGRNDEVHPLEGEIWHVVLTARGCARTVVPAIKGIIGWYVTPTSVESTLYDDCHIASRHVYPVERIAESPTVNHKEN